MGLRKGQTNNPKGRPKGSVNRKTTELKDRVKNFLQENWTDFEEDFKKIEPKDRVQFFEKLLKYVIPINGTTSLSIDYKNMTDDQLDLIIKKLTNVTDEKD